MRPALVALLLLAATARADVDPDRLEPAVLPAVAYDSDAGLGFGAIATLVQFRPGYAPYRFKLTAQVYLTIKEAPDGGYELPYHDDFVALDVPGLLDDRLRLGLRLAFGRLFNGGYYGLGNGARIDAERAAANPRVYQYDRLYPELETTARLALSRGVGRLDAVLGGRLAYNRLRPYAGSQLEEDLADGVIVDAQRFLLTALSAGLLFDLRDHESVPRRGFLAEVTGRAGYGVGEGFGYAGVKTTLRGFVPLWRDHVVVGARAVVDALAGDPPVYELAIGGATTLRGVRGQRYHGRIKLYGNGELRLTLVRFHLGSQRFAFGVLGFLDAGSVFGNGARDTGHVAWSSGGGARLRWGEHFLVRVDLGVSPSDETSGLYIGADHLF